MNINPNPAAASIAGTSRAAARGGEADNQASEATRQQATAEKPGGKSVENSALDAGDQAGDRGGDGRQVLDVFERSGEREKDEQPAAESDEPAQPPAGHIDLQG